MIEPQHSKRLIELTAGTALVALGAVAAFWVSKEIGPVATVASASTIWACVATLLALLRSSDAERERVIFLTAAMRFSIALPTLERARFMKAILEGNTRVIATHFSSWTAYLADFQAQARSTHQ